MAKQYFINIDPRTNRTLEFIPKANRSYNEQILDDVALYFHKTKIIKPLVHLPKLLTESNCTFCSFCQNPAIVFCEKCERFFCTGCEISTNCTVLIKGGY